MNKSTHPDQPALSFDPPMQAPSFKQSIEHQLTVLQPNPILSRLDRDARRLVAEHFDAAAFPEGTVVVREACEGQDMFFILEGQAVLSRANIDLGTLGPGEHFGELSLISRHVRAATVIAVKNLVTARLSRDQYDALAQKAPDVALRFTQALVSSLGTLLTEMTDSMGLLLHERSLPRRVTVEARVAGVLHKVRTGTPIGTLLPESIDGFPTVAGLINHKALSLSTPLTSDADVSRLTTGHWEGQRVYRQSLGLLLLEAAKKVSPDAVVQTGISYGFAQRVHVDPPEQDPTEWADRVNRIMHEQVAASVGFNEEMWTLEETRSHFDENGWNDASALLQMVREPAIPLVTCGTIYALGSGPFVPNAKVLGNYPFHVRASDDGVWLHYGDEEEVEPALPVGHTLPRVGQRMGPEEEPWLRTLGVTSVGAFNEACITGSVSQIIRVSEGLHEKRIGQIADLIAQRANTVRIICIAGPSSSGKTTLIKRLTVQLQVNGLHPIGISLDDYYLDRVRMVRGPDGHYDFEALEALDVPLLQSHIARLLAGDAVATAKYDFLRKVNVPDGGPRIVLQQNDVLMLEGIHGLNPRLLGDAIHADQVFRIFVQPSTALAFDRLSRVGVSDIRLLRRIVRDRHQRATNAADNILRWPSVRTGERAHIIPYVHHADALFDSSLVYEISVIKVFADRYLLEVPPDHPAAMTAHRLRRLIDRFVTIYPDHVPPTSILREFIGGSGFEY